MSRKPRISRTCRLRRVRRIKQRDGEDVHAATPQDGLLSSQLADHELRARSRKGGERVDKSGRAEWPEYMQALDSSIAHQKCQPGKSRDRTRLKRAQQHCVKATMELESVLK